MSTLPISIKCILTCFFLLFLFILQFLIFGISNLKLNSKDMTVSVPNYSTIHDSYRNVLVFMVLVRSFKPQFGIKKKYSKYVI